VLAPGTPRRRFSSRALGVVIPALALALGVSIVRIHGGAGFLATVGTVATPTLAAAAGWARGWRAPWLPAAVVPLLYLLAWWHPGRLDGEAAAAVLIGGACLAVGGLVAAVAPVRALVVGLVLLVVLDVILVWGSQLVESTSTALQAATPPTVGGRALPSLQQVDFGSATMGWLDFAAPALLGLLVRRRLDAATATGAAAALWGLLLFATSPIAATPPVLAGLVAGRECEREPDRRRRAVRGDDPAMASPARGR
jgi:hypothetical protein